MQFHLDGFQPGDPDRARADAARATASAAPMPDEVDVLIVGSGPAGLVLAAQLAAFPDITTRIVEQKAGPLELGQADGIACRTVEMFDAFGFSERLLREAYWVNETVFWRPDESDRTRIVRSGRVRDTEEGLSEFPHLIINQARVHDHLLAVMANSPSRLTPDYSRSVERIEVEPAATHPVVVTLRQLASDGTPTGTPTTVRARYVVGCDGARSAVRTAIGRSLRGDAANQAWGVMDVLAVTDFPDIRLKTAVQSSNGGNILIIPREGGHLVRLYIELDKLGPGERVSARGITSDTLIAAARRILHPFSFDVQEIAWWSVYEIGQRLTDRFDDVFDEGQDEPHIFIAGDACHTHSPKAGQGMNVSMQDAFNLGWKLAAVLRGQSSPSLLRTYSDERQAVAAALIDFDRDFAKMFSTPPKDPTRATDDGVDPQQFQARFIESGRYTAGVATRYERSVLRGESAYQNLASGFPIGERFHSAPVIRLADAKPMQLGHVAQADGRWRIYAFADADDPREASSGLRGLCDFLADSPESPTRRFTPEFADVDAVFDLRAVFQQSHHEITPEVLPAVLLPRKGRYGLVDYEKAFCPDLRSSETDVFDLRGIDRRRGAAVVVRPDQYVAAVLPLGAYDLITEFFSNFMLAAPARQAVALMH
ncbi:FAD-binding monooxygenase [uncultured Amnibacterium sp.]|uniref:FAD-binding monooxygenase n=1 Tax=uncultured Amnibacterium sp. TaxID=1631851 RepID=UPI0035C96A8A